MFSTPPSATAFPLARSFSSTFCRSPTADTESTDESDFRGFIVRQRTLILFYFCVSVTISISLATARRVGSSLLCSIRLKLKGLKFLSVIQLVQRKIPRTLQFVKDAMKSLLMESWCTTSNHTRAFKYPKRTCSDVTSSRSYGSLFAAREIGLLRHQMQFRRNCNTNDLKNRFWPALVSRRNKAGIWILQIMLMIPLAIKASPVSKAL